jgi:hypothetical protein
MIALISIIEAGKIDGSPKASKTIGLNDFSPYDESSGYNVSSETYDWFNGEIVKIKEYTKTFNGTIDAYNFGEFSRSQINGGEEEATYYGTDTGKWSYTLSNGTESAKYQEYRFTQINTPENQDYFDELMEAVDAATSEPDTNWSRAYFDSVTTTPLIVALNGTTTIESFTQIPQYTTTLLQSESLSYETSTITLKNFATTTTDLSEIGQISSWQYSYDETFYKTGQTTAEYYIAEKNEFFIINNGNNITTATSYFPKLKFFTDGYHTNSNESSENSKKLYDYEKFEIKTTLAGWSGQIVGYLPNQNGVGLQTGGGSQATTQQIEFQSTKIETEAIYIETETVVSNTLTTWIERPIGTLNAHFSYISSSTENVVKEWSVHQGQTNVIAYESTVGTISSVTFGCLIYNSFPKIVYESFSNIQVFNESIHGIKVLPNEEIKGSVVDSIGYLNRFRSVQPGVWLAVNNFLTGENAITVLLANSYTTQNASSSGSNTFNGIGQSTAQIEAADAEIKPALIASHYDFAPVILGGIKGTAVVPQGAYIENGTKTTFFESVKFFEWDSNSPFSALVPIENFRTAKNGEGDDFITSQRITDVLDEFTNADPKYLNWPPLGITGP